MQYKFKQRILETLNNPDLLRVQRLLEFSNFNLIMSSTHLNRKYNYIKTIGLI